MLRAIVVDGIAVSGDRHNHVVGRSDLQFTRRLRRQRVVRRDVCIAGHHLQIIGITAVVIGANRRALRRRVSDACRLTIHYITKGICRFSRLLRAIVNFLVVLDAHRDQSRRNLQRAVGLADGELRRHVVSSGILHHSCAADSVRQVRHIRALRVARRQAGNGVGIPLHREIQLLESINALLRAVIHVARAALRDNRNHIFIIIGTVGNC